MLFWQALVDSVGAKRTLSFTAAHARIEPAEELEAGYGDNRRLGDIAARPRAGWIVGLFCLLARVLDGQEQRAAVGSEGWSRKLGLDRTAGELVDLSAGPRRSFGHKERPSVLYTSHKRAYAHYGNCKITGTPPRWQEGGAARAAPPE